MGRLRLLTQRAVPPGRQVEVEMIAVRLVGLRAPEPCRTCRRRAPVQAAQESRLHGRPGGVAIEPWRWSARHLGSAFGSALASAMPLPGRLQLRRLHRLVLAAAGGPPCALRLPGRCPAWRSPRQSPVAQRALMRDPPLPASARLPDLFLATGSSFCGRLLRLAGACRRDPLRPRAGRAASAPQWARDLDGAAVGGGERGDVDGVGERVLAQLVAVALGAVASCGRRSPRRCAGARRGCRASRARSAAASFPPTRGDAGHHRAVDPRRGPCQSDPVGPRAEAPQQHRRGRAALSLPDGRGDLDLGAERRPAA